MVVLSASRAATRSLLTAGVLLDVLAPAVCSHSAAQRRHRSTAAPAPTASTSQLASDPSSSSALQSSSSAASSGPSSSKEKTGTDARRPPRKRRVRPPPLEAEPSAVALLSRIRQHNPPAASPKDIPEVIRTHNLAVLSLNRGIADKHRPNYQHAFQQGWLPLRRSGMVGRLPPLDIAKVLVAATAIGKENPDRIRVDWLKLKELILWICGGDSHDAKIYVSDWAWESLSSGPAGCERVVEIFDALMADEHVALRSHHKAPDFASRDPNPFRASKAAETKMTSWLFAACVAAKTLLRDMQQPRPPFSDFFPAFLDRSLPRLSSFLEHSKSVPLLKRTIQKRHRTFASDASNGSAYELALSALRQISLAQTWYTRRDAPAIGLWQLIGTRFRAGEHAKAWELWKDVQQAIEDREVRWMSTQGWSATGWERWISKPMRDDLERLERRGFADEGEEDDFVPPPSLPRSSASPDSPSHFPPAHLHQALVAKFLSGFAYSRQLEHAESIWTWLASQFPPLTPGVVCWTGLLNGYARRGDLAAVEAAFAEMKDSGVEPDVWAWLDRISAHFEAKLPDEAVRLVGLMKRDPAVLRYLDREYGGRLPEAAYNALIVGLLGSGRRVEAEAILDEMDKAGRPPSTYTINGFMKHYTRGHKPDLAATARLIQLVTTRGLEANVHTFTMVLMALLAAGQRNATAKTLAIMEASQVKPTVTTYGAIMASLARTGKVEHLQAAVQLLDEMESKKLATNQVHYTALIQGFLRAMASTTAEAAAAVIPSSLSSLAMSSDSKEPSPAAAAAAAQDGHQQHPYLLAALTLKTRMEKRGLALNRVGYNALLSALLDLQTEEGVVQALKLFREMNRRLARSSSSSSTDFDAAEKGGRQVTSSDTWYILLSAFARAKDWPRAHAVVLEMERSKFEVRSKGLAKLVRFVTRREYQYTGTM